MKRWGTLKSTIGGLHGLSALALPEADMPLDAVTLERDLSAMYGMTSHKGSSLEERRLEGHCPSIRAGPAG